MNEEKDAKLRTEDVLRGRTEEVAMYQDKVGALERQVQQALKNYK